MIEVCGVVFGCQWDGQGHVKAWPMRVQFGAVGPEATVEEMLEGRGFTMMRADQLGELLTSLQNPPGEVELRGMVPMSAVDELLSRGFRLLFVES